LDRSQKKNMNPALLLATAQQQELEALEAKELATLE
jgi:hypothetical protein